MSFHYTGAAGDELAVRPGLVNADTGQAVAGSDDITFTIHSSDGSHASVCMPVDVVEDAIAGIRDTARQARRASEGT